MADSEPIPHPDPALVVEAIGLVKKFGSTTAVGGISLEARAGEALCVIGPNGAGKTTLLLLLGGVLLPSAGHVRVFGLHRWKDNFDIRTRSTFLTADPIFGASPTPYEFLRFFAQIYRLPKPDFLERAQRLVDEMQMEPHLDKPWHRLSLGMKKKVGIIAAFLPDAGLRIMDEPFAGGVDPLGMERLYEWIGAAKGRGETILFSTQVLEQAESCSDRLLVLTNGAIAASGPPVDLIRQAGVDPAEPRALNKAFMRLTAP